jgi:3-methylcrotonyl-CoA carboxylase alpha subunit
VNVWLTVEHEGKRYRVAVTRSPDGLWVGWQGRTAFVGDRRKRADDETGDANVRAPMPGRVVQISAASGDAVEADDVLVILEAMKMEYRLRAPRRGRVADCNCKEGDLVDLGETLVTLMSA